MPSPRSFLLHLTLAGAATLVLCLTAYVGLGWAVWKRAWPAYHLSRQQFDRLERAYARALSGLLSGDSDSDGIRDGAEIFWHRNPDSPADTDVDLFPEDFRVQDIRERSNLPGGLPIPFSPSDSSASVMAALPRECEPFQVQPGERRRVRAGMLAFSSFDSFFPRFAFADRLPIRLIPAECSEKMVRFPGSTLHGSGSPSSGSPPGSPVTMTSGGWVEFEFEVPEGAKTDLEKVHDFAAVHAVRNEPLAGFSFRCVWRWPPQPLVVEKQDLTSPREWSGEVVQDPFQIFQLSWPPVDSRAEAILLEIARDEPNAEFIAIREYPTAETRCVLVRPLPDEDDYRGALKFRIVPISSTRPAD